MSGPSVKRYVTKNEEGFVDMDTKVLESNFTSGKSVQVRLCSSGDVVVVKTVNVTVDGESLSIFPIFLAYSTTVRMAQSFSKICNKSAVDVMNHA